MLIKNHHLLPTQIADLENLVAVCTEHDAGSPAFYRHLLIEHREAPNILYYHAQQLLGCVSVFYFYAEACEISLFVHPAYRRQGIGHQLLQAIVPLLKKRNCKKLIFSSAPSQSTWISSLGMHKEESEYNMLRTADTPLPQQTNHLEISRATHTDIPILFTLDQACFPEHHSRSLKQFAQWLARNDYQIIIALYQQQVIGKAHIRILRPQQVILSDIAIVPTLQKRGFGSELLQKTLHYIYTMCPVDKPQIQLSVATQNSSHALSLYLKHGFQITSQCDYWSIHLVNFLSILDSLS